MLRRTEIGAGLALLLCLAPAAPARAAQGSGAGQETGHGCGGSAEYQRSGLIEDLPACDDRSAVGQARERALREARDALLAARLQLDAEAAEAAEAAQRRVDEAIAQAATLAAEEGEGGKLAPLLPLYERAADHLRARGSLLHELDGLRACHAQAQVLRRGEGTQAEVLEMPAAQSVMAQAEECMGLLRRLLAQKPVQQFLDGPPALEVEVAPGQARRLADLFQDVRAAHKRALALRQAAQKEWEVVRARWLRLLYSDRLRVFNEHPDQLPEYDGKERGPLPASVLPRWRYALPDGRMEIYNFRRHKLISRVIEDPRRS